MWYEDYFKKHPYLIRQVGVGAVSVLTFAVVVGEHKIEAERRFYRDDLPAHAFHYESPLPMTHCLASGSGTTTSLSFVPFNYGKESTRFWPAISGDSINL